MQKKVVSILVVVIVILVSILVVSASASKSKLSKAQAEIAVLSDIITQKDTEIMKLDSLMQDKQRELDIVRGELENVKTELSNTVIRLQALPVDQGAAVKK